MISEVARAVLAEMETGLDALRTDMDLVAEYQERVFARQVAVEQHRISYLPIESVSMQERVRAVEFVLSRCGLGAPEIKPRARARTIPPVPTAPDVLKASIESWPYALADSADHDA